MNATVNKLLFIRYILKLMHVYSSPIETHTARGQPQDSDEKETKHQHVSIK